jgi:Tfp pilus assembly protein PilF
MPAVTVPVIALGGAALAGHASTRRPRGIPSGAAVPIALLLIVTAIAPGLVFASQRASNDAFDALHAGNCATAIRRASDSVRLLAIRPEPYEVISLCQVRAGRPNLALQAMRRAVHRDPDNWRYHFELAAIQGGLGLDPHTELATARRLNPHNADVNNLLATVKPGEAVDWGLELQKPTGSTAKAGQ